MKPLECTPSTATFSINRPGKGRADGSVRAGFAEYHGVRKFRACFLQSFWGVLLADTCHFLFSPPRALGGLLWDANAA